VRLGVGELLLSACRLSLSKTEVRTGEGGGNTSSTGFRGVRCLFGEPEGLSGRSCGGYKIRPAPSTPGIDRVRPMVKGGRLAVDLERTCKPERGDAVRGLYGRVTEGGNSGELGEAGSVDRRMVGGFRLASTSLDTRRRVGRGAERNSSILSVSGTGSMLALFRYRRLEVFSVGVVECRIAGS